MLHVITRLIRGGARQRTRSPRCGASIRRRYRVDPSSARGSELELLEGSRASACTSCRSGARTRIRCGTRGAVRAGALSGASLSGRAHATPPRAASSANGDAMGHSDHHPHRARVTFHQHLSPTRRASTCCSERTAARFTHQFVASARTSGGIYLPRRLWASRAPTRPSTPVCRSTITRGRPHAGARARRAARPAELEPGHQAVTMVADSRRARPGYLFEAVRRPCRGTRDARAARRRWRSCVRRSSRNAAPWGSRRVRFLGHRSDVPRGARGVRHLGADVAVGRAAAGCLVQAAAAAKRF